MIEPLLIAWLIVYFTPIQQFLCYLNVKVLTDVLTCFKCTSFWVTLIYGAFFYQFFIYYAIANSIIAYVFSRIDNQFPTKL